VPALSFSYFDPASGRIVRTETAPLPLRVEAAAATAGVAATLDSKAEVTFVEPDTVHPGQRVVAALEWSPGADPAARLELGSAAATAGSRRIEGWAVPARDADAAANTNGLVARLIAPPSAAGTAVVIRDVHLETSPSP